MAFELRFDHPIARSELLSAESGERAPRYLLAFDLGRDRRLQAKVALSTTDVDGARRNLTEVAGWDFEAVAAAAAAAWESQLGRVEITGDLRTKRIFYTALYHACLHPSVLSAATIAHYGPEITRQTLALNTESRPLEERSTYERAFLQVMNLWERSALVREFVLGKRLGRIAADLLEVDGVRLCHHQSLYNEPRGFSIVDDPFELGEVSFHLGWTFHRAGANRSALPRSVMTVIYMDQDMRLKEPSNDLQRNDWAQWCPGAVPGQIIRTARNPLIYSR